MKAVNMYKTSSINKDAYKRKLDSSITIRVDNDTKEKFEKICTKMGLSVSSVISAFITKVVNTGTIPFLISVHNTNQKKETVGGKHKFYEKEINRLDKEIAKVFGV